MKATCIEDFSIYQGALKAADAVAEVLKRPAMERDRRLREQLAGSSAAVPALMAEGFGLGTDRQFAQNLYRARGESKETRTHLRIARGRGYVTTEECESLCAKYDEIERMTTSLIRHLQKEDRRVRG
jgi:four helix bundle protein